jgi:Raf kinase inhibitor-like YbhB/YbcL family protein
MTLRITSTAFTEGKPIPPVYTCQGQNINPPLAIAGVPPGTKSLTLVVDDPDAPMGTWDHWVMWNIDPATTKINENSEPLDAIQGRNSGGMNRYAGPCPPSGTHRYFFKLYALDARLTLPSSAAKRDLESAMQGHILAQAQLMGTYKKNQV